MAIHDPRETALLALALNLCLRIHSTSRETIIQMKLSHAMHYLET